MRGAATEWLERSSLVLTWVQDNLCAQDVKQKLSLFTHAAWIWYPAVFKQEQGESSEVKVWHLPTQLAIHTGSLTDTPHKAIGYRKLDLSVID